MLQPFPCLQLVLRGGCDPASRQLQPCQQRGRHSTLLRLGSEASGAAGKNCSGAEFAVSDYLPWVYISCSR